MLDYMPRLIENEIKEQMHVSGGIELAGPKWCGKSTTAMKFAKSMVLLQFKNVFERYRLLAANDTRKLLEGEKPLMFDEWQKVPEIWDAVRADVDITNLTGQYFLTGSVKAKAGSKQHSGQGRIVTLMMRPMSLFESRESTGEISLEALFDGVDNISGETSLTIARLSFLACRGGWPKSVRMSDRHALLAAKNYYKVLVQEDLNDVDEIKRDPERAMRILRAYARHISSLASNRTIISDVESGGIDEKTLSSYLNAFRKLYVIEDILAWAPRLRSKTAIRSSAKRQFVDPSVAAAALGATPEKLLDDVNTLGFFFESLCARDLRIYAESIGGKIYHYRDNKDLEADIIIELENGDWAAVEIKLGGHQIDDAAKNLIRLKNKVVEGGVREPKFLMVLTGLNYAYRRKEDGVLVVPIGCLKN